MKWCKILFLIALVSFLVGCGATVPKEAITLSELLGEDLVKTQTSYQTLVRNQYAEIRNDIEDFIQNTYTPFVLREVIENKRVIYVIKDKVDSGSYSDAFNYMTSFSKAANNQIEKFRKEMLDPIKIQEQELLEKIDLAYTNMRNANATITAHLKSIKKVHDEQDKILEHANLLDLKNSVLNQTVKLSTNIQSLLDKSQITQESNTKEILDGIKKIIDDSKKESKPDNTQGNN